MDEKDDRIEEVEERRYPFCVKCKTNTRTGIKFCPKCHGLVLYFTQKQITFSKQQKPRKSKDGSPEEEKPLPRSKRTFPEFEDEDDFKPYASGQEKTNNDDDILD
jgi:hypothetical protein